MGGDYLSIQTILEKNCSSLQGNGRNILNSWKNYGKEVKVNGIE